MQFMDKIEPLTTENKLCTGFINQAMVYLQKQHPEIDGLFCCTLGQHIDFPQATGEKWVQIVHDGYFHWLVVAKGFFEPNLVLVYDSMAGSKWESKHVIGCMASLVRTPEKTLRYKVKACQRQGNGFDCGVFAIAFATSIANGIDPATLVYTPNQMRDHLRACFEKKKLTQFPSTICVTNRDRREAIAEADIYCSCRRSSYLVGNSSMVECETCLEWYHQSCISNYPTSNTQTWNCINCEFLSM